MSGSAEIGKRVAEGDGEDDVAELIAQLRELAGDDPAGVRQVVAEVLAALDRVAGGALRDELPEAIRRDTEHVVPPGRPEAPTP